jgi:hypothetical protein
MLVVLSISSLVIVTTSISVTSSVILLLHLISSLILLHDFNQLLENLSHMWMRYQVIEVESTTLLGNIFLKALLVYHFVSFELSNLLDFIMINDQLFSFNSMIMKGLFGLGSSVWSHVANKGICSV